MRFCAKTKGLTKDQNKKFAKDLKDFTKKEAQKFKDEESQQDQESEE